MQWLIDVLAGDPSPEALAHLQRAFTAWSNASATCGAGTGRKRFPSLSQCLGLPANPEHAQRQVRDWYLLQASELVGANFADRAVRARRLHQAVQRFMARQWPCWWDLSEPPAHADALQKMLWHAARAGAGRLPKTRRRYGQLLAGSK
ncbi:hypothetical protein [Comamonas sp. NLF-1-9]|uniref:hypothetical protein n=1 Tax=Comamonas sp. NLF-1-9 TaxID=2853163 RepID=UPI001C442D14|nr:hypothetical protein [Comamonas sp. NLF-1-9]QXL83264.1 hypothetical protein KUD94_08265 [Comamonas sp. NLF-1-9]